MFTEKLSLHTRNLHRDPYDFDLLISCVPELKHYVFLNSYGTKTINFSIPKAVKLLNKALLQYFYQVANWDIPDANLCPPIPGRADYVHYIADVLAGKQRKIPLGLSVQGLDIGTGANLVYPLIAHRSYGWKMWGTDINEDSLQNGQRILDNNLNLKGNIQLMKQPDSGCIFKNMITADSKFAFTMCNPPFHNSEASALKGNLRKTKNLNKLKIQKPHLNFGGQQTELWCEGGEIVFVSTMITESALFADQVLWFTCLVSKKDNLPRLMKLLTAIKALDVRIIEMVQGQKISRILVWTFIDEKKRKTWGF